MITRALGIESRVDVDAGAVEPFRGDRFVLCSDGLTDEVDDDRIASVLRRLDDPNEAAAELVRVALQNGGRDNVTVVVVDVADDDDRAGAASSALGRDPSSSRSHDDPAGFTTATEPTSSKTATDTKPKPKEKKEKQPRPKRFTWRVAVFLLAFVVVLGGAAGAIGYFARNTYFVGFAGDEVAIFKGKPEGVLWFDPTLEERTGIARADVPPSQRARLTAGHEEPTLEEAREYVENLREETQPTTTTTTSTTTSTTTTVPTTVTPTTVTPG